MAKSLEIELPKSATELPGEFGQSLKALLGKQKKIKQTGVNRYLGLVEQFYNNYLDTKSGCINFLNKYQILIDFYSGMLKNKLTEMDKKFIADLQEPLEFSISVMTKLSDFAVRFKNSTDRISTKIEEKGNKTIKANFIELKKYFDPINKNIKNN